MQNQGVLNASLAGIFAAFAGLCAKFALSEDDPHAFLRLGEILHFPSEYNAWIVRGALILASLAFNSLMLTSTAKALQLCSTSVQAVVTTSAVNFLITGVIGTLFLGEYLGFMCVIGMIFIQIGILIISHEDKAKKD